MNESEIASTQLSTMINDVEAVALFAKGGPLSWFFLERTYASAFSKGTLTEKQIPLIFSVYERYMNFKSASKRFSATGKSSEIAAVLYRILRERPEATSREDRSISQRLSRLVHAFHEGVLVHIGHFNDAESIIGELPIENKIAIWEMLHSARRAYLVELYGHA